jgi:hypothetical protein
MRLGRGACTLSSLFALPATRDEVAFDPDFDSDFDLEGLREVGAMIWRTRRGVARRKHRVPTCGRLVQGAERGLQVSLGM